MVELKRSEISLIEKFMSYPQGMGYVLNYSDRTFSEFFEDEFRIDIEEQRFLDRGGSKRHRLISFCLQEPASIVTRVLRVLSDNRKHLVSTLHHPPDDGLEGKFEALVTTLETVNDQPRTDALYRYEQDRTLDEFIRDLERTIGDNKPEAALDHLHTYCMRKFAFLLSLRDIQCDQNEALHSRFGKYRKCLVSEYDLQVISDLSMKSAISIFEKFNVIRNDHSLAHDNEILAHAEARYIFDAVTALLRFVRSLEAGRFEVI